jgi:hypothetical protein
MATQSNNLYALVQQTSSSVHLAYIAGWHTMVCLSTLVNLKLLSSLPVLILHVNYQHLLFVTLQHSHPTPFEV